MQNKNFTNLDIKTQNFLQGLFANFRFTFQEKKQLIDFAIDFAMWQEKSIEDLLSKKNLTNKNEIFNFVRDTWRNLSSNLHSYENFSPNYTKKQYQISTHNAPKLALGSCPVASTNTRCCNLLTLDAVNSCGFDCSYCSIQSFYNDGKISFDESFAKNLSDLKLNPNLTYHIGTGQSSDSLMWGNKFGILDALCKFANENQNVILELKTKSNNIKYLLKNQIPKNIIVTFSLNTPTIIKNEEHLSATLSQRIEAAKALNSKNILVGFHFHPMIRYENYLKEYDEIFKSLTDEFDPSLVALVSFGTLTFIKPVIKKIHARKLQSKILQMPLTKASGKLSYPLEIKKEMFSFAYKSFEKWHNKVFFYMCMEDISLWQECFGYEYSSNLQMEKAMEKAYLKKIWR